MFLTAIVGLVMLYELDGPQEQPVDFYKDAGWKGVVLGIGLGLIVLLANVVVSALNLLSTSHPLLNNSLLTAVSYNSFLFVPKYFGTTTGQNYPIVSNMTFEYILTAPGEEALKAAMMYGFFLKWKSANGSIFASIAIWASFHTILVNFTPIEVAAAMGSGLAWYYLGWRVTQNLLTPILAHGTYDASIVLLGALSAPHASLLMIMIPQVSSVLFLALGVVIIKKEKNNFQWMGKNLSKFLHFRPPPF